MIINGQDQDIRGDVTTCNAVWDRYFELLGQQLGERYRASELMTNGFVTGRLDANLTTRLQDMAKNATEINFKADDATDDYAFTPNARPYEAGINVDHRHLHLTPEMLWHLNDATEALDGAVQDAIGTPWRVLNARMWNTPTPAQVSKGQGSLAWHDDGMPRDMLKLLVYLTDQSADTGTVEWKISDTETTALQGPAGSWLLFKNSVVFHRGIAPTRAGCQRTMLEFTLMPSLKNQTSVIHGGNNGRHPWRFWQTDFA